MVRKSKKRCSHSAPKYQIPVDGRALGTDIQSEVYDLFNHYISRQGRAANEKLGTRERRLQTTVPDLTTTNRLEGPVLQTPGLQLHEIKRVQSILSSSRTTGMPNEPSDLWSVRRRSPFLRAAGRRVAKIPKEYKAKAREEDIRFVGGGSGQIL